MAGGTVLSCEIMKDESAAVSPADANDVWEHRNSVLHDT